MKEKGANKKLCLACSLGGHLAQMQELRELYVNYEHFFITEASEISSELAQTEKVYMLKLANRRMKTIPFILMANAFRSLRILLKERPGVVISTGALNAVPVCFLAKMLGCKLIFIESFAKVYEPTLSGRIVYPIADLFVVQWETLLKAYPKAVCGGSLY